jgi:hypothetical protein
LLVGAPLHHRECVLADLADEALDEQRLPVLLSEGYGDLAADDPPALSVPSVKEQGSRARSYLARVALTR